MEEGGKLLQHGHALNKASCGKYSLFLEMLLKKVRVALEEISNSQLGISDSSNKHQ